MAFKFETELGGRTLTLETGRIARQADGAVLARYGDTIVLVTSVASRQVREGLDFVPLTVEYMEKGYAAGKIPGNYFRREIGRPSEKETLTARIIDRPIRPLFPKEYRNETQVIATVLSADKENEPDVLALIGASAALEVSGIPFARPVAAVRVGKIEGELIINPSIKEWDKSTINLIVAGTEEAVVMVEGEGNNASESEMLEAIFFGHREMQPILEIQKKLREATGKQKRTLAEVKKDEVLVAEVEKVVFSQIQEAIKIVEKLPRQDKLEEIKENLLNALSETWEDRAEEIKQSFYALERRAVRELAIKDGKRIDGRRFDEVREITCEVGILPRAHGSCLFTRGETQALGSVTLGSTGDEQRMETLNGEVFRPFMLHYNFPPYCVNEVRRSGGPGRREIGHGALATRAVAKILPDSEAFAYTIRIVSEIMESNGSSSMATVCAGSMALMDAGVPVKEPVAGIAMGLMKESENVIILSDILGDEDHMGDMDFKVAGTREGINALQMDIKIDGLTEDIMEKALEQARAGRLFILDKMAETIKESRSELSEHAPMVFTLKINPDKIRDIIGPGGKVIRAIQAETGTRLDVDDLGNVKITAENEELGKKALKMVEEIVQEVEVGALYDGTVRKIMDFGAFVEVLPGTDGLVHISQLDFKPVQKVTDILNVGDKVKVKVLEVNRDGKIRLSRKAALRAENDQK
ncbi:MAG: polyribonucleotide nucleotidyltransferase [Deltaproteobacteria bacterium]|nr:polyribonucleotide nucleotidyltransferase [Deltaproteobacteria bacterium]